jgi:hypothetical protein
MFRKLIAGKHKGMKEEAWSPTLKKNGRFFHRFRTREKSGF